MQVLNSAPSTPTHRPLGAEEFVRFSRDFQWAEQFGAIERTVELAKLRCVQVPALLQRLAARWADPDENCVICRLLECELTRNEERSLAVLLRQIIITSETARSAMKTRAENVVRRLSELVPRVIAGRLLGQCIRSSRKHCRE